MSEQERDNGQEVRNAEVNGPCAATPAAEIERYLFDPNIPKNEAEHYAARVITDLREQIRRMSTGNPQGEKCDECANDPFCTRHHEAERSDSRATGEKCSYRDVVAGASCIRPDMPHEEHWLPVTTARRVIDTRPYYPESMRKQDEELRPTETCACRLAGGLSADAIHGPEYCEERLERFQRRVYAEAEQRDGRIETGKGASYAGKVIRTPEQQSAAAEAEGWPRVSEESGDNGRKGGNAETEEEADEPGFCVICGTELSNTCERCQE